VADDIRISSSQIQYVEEHRWFRQNTSHAVMAQRIEPLDSFDDFPTPPWATRALIEYVLDKPALASTTCLEPACGRGHMARVLADYFGSVVAADVFDYGFGTVADFLATEYPDRSIDWVISNPPYRLAEAFILRALPIARHGVAMLVRTSFIESVGRYGRLFRPYPPAVLAQFTERVPMLRSRLDRDGSTATAYAWIVWRRGHAGGTRLVWIPPCRKALERDGDYRP
jgi:hypothetical protein